MKYKLLRYSLLSMLVMLCGGGIFAIGQALSKANEAQVVYTLIYGKYFWYKNHGTRRLDNPHECLSRTEVRKNRYVEQSWNVYLRRY